MLCWMAFVAVLSVWLGQTLSTSFIIVCIPLYAHEAMDLLSMLGSISKGTFQKLKDAEKEAFMFKSYPEYVLHLILIQALRISQLGLLVAKIHSNDSSSNVPAISWWIVGIPVWVGAGYSLLRMGLRCMRVRRESQNPRAEPLRATDDDRDKDNKDSVQAICLSCCCGLPVLAFFILLAARLESQLGRSLAIVFIPIFAVIGCIFCVACVSTM